MRMGKKGNQVVADDLQERERLLRGSAVPVAVSGAEPLSGCWQQQLQERETLQLQRRGTTTTGVLIQSRMAGPGIAQTCQS